MLIFIYFYFFCEITELYSPYKKLKCCPIHDPDFYAEKEKEMDDLLSRKADEVDE